MKILHVIPSLDVGGTEKIVLELCRGLDKRSFEQAVVALKGGGRTEKALKESGISVTCLGSSDSFAAGLAELPWLYQALKKKISDFSPQVLHTWLSRANFIGR